MYRYLKVENGIVTATIETSRAIENADYLDYTATNQGVDFLQVIGSAVNGDNLFPSKEQTERVWRETELKIVQLLLLQLDHPYAEELKQYQQVLRDYPLQADFPDGERPTRPLTPAGLPIITE